MGLPTLLLALLVLLPLAAARACAVAVLGNSLVAGYGLADPATEAFPAVLERLLREQGFPCRVLNAGVSGDTSAGALARLDWVLAERPTHLIVEIGGNDVLRGLPAEQLARNLDAIVRRAQERGLAVFLAGMEAPRNWGEAYVAEVRQAYREVARRHGVPLDPFFLEGAWGVSGHMQPDELHPTAAGVEAIARRLLPRITAWLEATGVRPGIPQPSPSRRRSSAASLRSRRASSSRAARRACGSAAPSRPRVRRSLRCLRAPSMVKPSS